MPYDPNQPRIPAGNSNGGEWSDNQLSIIDSAAREGAGVSQKITSLDQIRNVNGKVYIRWSKSIVKDNERGYSLNHNSMSAEPGLSAVEIDKSWEDWRILRQIHEYEYISSGKPWIVTGDEVGTLGSDQETLLRNLKLIGVVDKKLINLDWKNMQRVSEIADLKERLTRITDPIGKKIVQRSLDELLNNADR